MQRKRSESAIAKDKLHATLLLLLRLLSRPQCTQPQPSSLAPAQVLLLSRRIFSIFSSIFMVVSLAGPGVQLGCDPWGNDDVSVLVVCEGWGCAEGASEGRGLSEARGAVFEVASHVDMRAFQGTRDFF